MLHTSLGIVAAETIIYLLYHENHGVPSLYMCAEIGSPSSL